MTENKAVLRRLPVGAEVQPAGGVHFRVWAPRRQRVEIALDRAMDLTAPAVYALEPESAGYFSALVRDAAPGMFYRYRLDGEKAYPNPASRFQPDGPHRPSQIIDPEDFAWTDHHWHGAELSGQVIYEMHLGTFTREGTWEAAARKCENLAAAGMTVLEIMPVGRFQRLIWLGLGRCRSLRPYAAIRYTERLSRFRRSRPQHWTCGYSRRHLQPLWPGRRLFHQIRGRVLHRSL